MQTGTGHQLSAFASAFVLTATAVAMLPGCGRDAGDGAGSTVRDSAGVLIVENRGAIWPEQGGWRVADAPEVEIGVAEGDTLYQLYRVVGVSRLANGVIVVADAGSHQLRFYDASGRFASATGRQGGGPGEFRQLGFLRKTLGDSLVTYDYGERRVSMLAPDGRFVRSFALQRAGPSLSPRPIGVFGDGSILVVNSRSFRPGGQPSGVTSDTSLYVRYSSDGTLLDSIGRFFSGQMYVVGDERSVTVTSLPFARFASAAPHGDHLYYGDKESYEIHVYAQDGRLTRIIRKRAGRLPVTPEDIAEVRRERLADARDPAWRQRTEEMLSEMPFPELKPAHGGIVVDAEGNLWVSEVRRVDDDQPSWSVFDPAGQFLGTVRTPRGLNVSEIGSDYVLGTWRDENDVVRVRLYRLRKTNT